MAKRKRKQSKRKSPKRKAKAKRAARKTTRKAAARKRKPPARKPRRTEAEMTWSEIRQARRRKSAGRFARLERDFARAANMTPQALAGWLRRAKSAQGDMRPRSHTGELPGQWSGRRVLEIKKKKPADYTAADYSHMRKVVAYVKRHSARRPSGDMRETPWRYALMNWGHDPLR